MKTAEFCKIHNADEEFTQYATSVSDEMADVWDAMIERGEDYALLWVMEQPGVFAESVLRKLACQFIRETPLVDGRKVWDLLTDERSRKAVEVAESYADGKATDSELSCAYDAAYAAAYAAVDAAADAAVDAAAYEAAARAAAAAHVRMISELGNPFKKES